jgi:hypothetical protein
MSAMPNIQKRARTTKMIRSLAGSPVVILTFSFSLAMILGTVIEKGEACTANTRHNNGIHRTRNMLQNVNFQFEKESCRKPRS